MQSFPPKRLSPTENSFKKFCLSEYTAFNLGLVPFTIHFINLTKVTIQKNTLKVEDKTAKLQPITLKLN